MSPFSKHLPANTQVELPEGYLRGVLHTLQEGIVAHDREGRVVWANQRAAALLKLSMDQLYGRSPPGAEHRVVRRDGTPFEPAEYPVAIALSTGKAQRDVQMGVIVPDCGTTWLLVSSEPVVAVGSVVTTFVDITSLVGHEEQLAQTRILHNATLENAGHAIIVADVQGNIQIFNPAAERMLGYRAEEMVGRQTPAVFHDPGEVVARAAELGIEPGFEVFVRGSRQGIAETREWTYVRKDGTTLPVSLTITAVRDAQGSIFGFMGIAQDISARKAMDLRLRTELAQRSAIEARMRGLIEALPDLVFRLSYEGLFREVHTPDPDLLLLPPEAILGKRYTDLLPPAVAAQVALRIEALRSGASVQPFSYELNIEGETRAFEARMVRSGEGEVAVIARDITEARALERMKDEFVSTVSHELRTPLTSIRGSLSLLNAGVIEPRSTEGKELLSAALRNAERLGRLIDDILDLDREQADLDINLQIAPLAPVLRQAVVDIEPFARSFDVELQLHVADERARVSVDPDRLSQVLYNLLSNAVKYGEPHSPVSVSLVEHDGKWRVQVKNRGGEIPEAFRPKLFQRFAMADASDRRKRGGTGLGLAISRALLERMGGTIDYLSTHEATIFFFDLPKLDERPPSQPERRDGEER